MVIFSSVLFFLLIITQIDRCSSHVWTDQRCSADTLPDMSDGIVKELNRFPWLGILQHDFNVGGKIRHAITTAVLVHSLYAIAAAEDVARIPITQLSNNTKMYFWGRPDPRELYAVEVKDYILHPQFKSQLTFATIALVSLVGKDETVFSNFRAPVLPICMPVGGGHTFEEMYAIKLTDEMGELHKQVLKMEYVDSKTCEEFYFQKGLYSEKFNPVNPLCAMATYNKTACVWDAGTALVVRQSYGYWKLIGLSVRGPGCGVPTKFLNIHDYLPWMNDVIYNTPRSEFSDEYRIGIRRVSPVKLIMFNPEAVPPSLGQCDREYRGNVLYKDWGEFIVNKDFVMGYYFIVITALQSVQCGELTMEGATQRTNIALWVENNCHSENEGSGIVDRISASGTAARARTNCFVYFKTSAFLEFRFTFSFSVVVSAVLYGVDQKVRENVTPWKTTQYTTAWWPTNEKIRFYYFATYARWWYTQ